MNQCQCPTGWIGRMLLRNMNARHSKVTDWGLRHVAVAKDALVLDVGCGGGRTVAKLAALASEGKVYGVDFSQASLAVANRTNRDLAAVGRVEIREGSVSRLPFGDGMFDLATAVETHFWWPDLPGDVREVRRVLKAGGRLAIVAEIYKGAKGRRAEMIERYAPKTGLKVLSAEEHRELLESAGFGEVRVVEEADKGWICCIGRK